MGGYGARSIVEKPLGAELIQYAQANKQDLVIMDLPDQGGEDETRWARITVPDYVDYILDITNRLNLSGRVGVGASLGGWALARAHQLHGALLWNALLLSPAFDWDKEYFAEHIAAGTIKWNGYFLKIERDNLKLYPDLIQTAPQARITFSALKLPGPIRILQGNSDVIVTPDSVARFQDRAKRACMVSVKYLDDVGHELSTLSAGDAVEPFLQDLDLLVENAKSKRRILRSRQPVWPNV